MRAHLLLVAVCLFVAAPAVSSPKRADPAAALIDRIAAFHLGDDAAMRRTVAKGRGFVTDSSHPKRPGDATRYDLSTRLTVDAYVGDGIFEFEVDGEEPGADRYFLRRGRPFQLDDNTKTEINASSLGDLSSSSIAALLPAIVARALVSRRENAQLVDSGVRAGTSILLFAWNDELWRVHADSRSGRIATLERRVHDDILGDRVELVRYEQYRGKAPYRIVVTGGDRTLAELELTSVSSSAARPALPKESEERSAHVIAPDDVRFREIAPSLFAVDLTPTNSRVVVAEFADHVAVIEGAYNSRNCDLLARLIRDRFDKPIRYFSMSHLHGQYLGGVRSYIHEGATVIVPPTTAPLVERIATATFDSRPDAQSRDPKPARVESVKETLLLEDRDNAMAVYNVASGHTDEYLVFHFPRQKVLLSGDLLFFRGVDQPLKGRSRQLCETIEKLGIEVESLYVSWPLNGYGGVRDTVRFDEFRAACALPSP